MTASFGDHVRIRQDGSSELERFSDLLGIVYGVTTPSVTNVEIVGRSLEDAALNVHFDELDAAYWFDPSVVEFVDHAAGTELQIDGAPVKAVRQADGSWLEVPVDAPEKPSLYRRLISWLGGGPRAV